MIKPLYEIDVKEVRENYDSGDSCLLDYLKDYITEDLLELYYDIINYNTIYANGWTLNELFEMGKEDKYWTKLAESFIEKYDIPKKDYQEFGKYFDKYTKLRDELIDKLGLSDYLDEDFPIEDIPSGGTLKKEIITPLSKIKDNDEYIVARIMNYGNSVSLYSLNGVSTIEYGYKIAHDYWEHDLEIIDWFNKNMNEDVMMDKLFERFEKFLGIQDKQKKMILRISEEYDVNFNCKIPFESFDSDNGNYNMASFTKYYKDIFDELDIDFNNMFTKGTSDGKYELILDNNVIVLTAWDSLENVIDNVESAIKFYEKKNIELEEK